MVTGRPSGNFAVAMSVASRAGGSAEPDEGLLRREVGGEAEPMMAGTVEHRTDMAALAAAVALTDAPSLLIG